MKLGMVTYLMGAKMELPELLKFCEDTGLEGVELRSTHAHNVELDTPAEKRREVKAMFADSPVAIAQYGTACEYQSQDPAVLKKNIEDTHAFAQLAADIGAPGIKVRPNRLHDDEPEEKTVERIGKALNQVGTFAEGVGVEIRVECHGSGTSHPRVMRAIMDAADHDNVYVNWNSNSVDMDENGSIDWSFDLLKHKLRYAHITDIGVYQYPWQDLFNKFKSVGFDGYCMAEIKANEDPVRFMKYYRTLFDLYTGNYAWPR